MIGMRAWESPIAWDDPTGRPMAEIDEAGSDLDGFLTGNRRVRKKSLYLGDSSDMNISLKQVRQSIVHVFDEWAEAPPNTIRISAFCSLKLAQQARLPDERDCRTPEVMLSCPTPSEGDMKENIPLSGAQSTLMRWTTTCSLTGRWATAWACPTSTAFSPGSSLGRN